MRRAFDCVGSGGGSPLSPPPVWPSASDNGVGTPEDLISQLHGWPACAPVNASAEALRPLPHDSGSGRLAGPSPYDSCIRYSLPVSRRTIRPAHRVLAWHLRPLQQGDGDGRQGVRLLTPDGPLAPAADAQ
jgi:hypothetical protein